MAASVTSQHRAVLPSVVYHYAGQWSNHQFSHLWGMLTLDVWRTDLLDLGDPKKFRHAGIATPPNTMATLRVYFQNDRRSSNSSGRCNVFELVTQPDGTLANDRLELVIMEVDTLEQRVGGCFLFTNNDCPQMCTHANSFQMTPQSMLCDLEA